MRRKIITIAVVAMLLVLLGVVEQISVRRITDSALGQTEAIGHAIRERKLEAAKEKSHALDEAWDRQAKWLEILVDHGSTDDVRYALSRLLAALEAKDEASALIYAGELEGSVEHVLERQAVTIENLL